MSAHSTKTGLIADGTKGVGTGIADRFAGPGMNLVIGYASDEEAARAAAEDLTTNGATTLLVEGDLRSG